MANFYESQDSEANWSASARVPSAGELAVATDIRDLRIGDGTTAWAGLRPYQPSVTPEWVNVHPDTLRQLRYAFNKAKNGSNMQMLVLGASIDTGIPTQGAQGSYPFLAMKALWGAGIPCGGSGWVPNFNNALDSRWTHGFGTNGGTTLLYYTSTAANQTETFVSTTPGDTLSLAFVTGGGAWTFTVDGAAGPAVTTTGTVTNGITYTSTSTAGGMSIYNFTLPQSGVHTIVVTATTTTAVKFVGLRLYKSTGGLELTDLAISGGLSTNNLSTAATGAPGSAAPALVGSSATYGIAIVGLDTVINDGLATNGAAQIATSKANIGSAISSLQGYGYQVILTLPQVPNPASGITAALWEQWRQAAYQLTVTYNVPMMDMTYRWKDFTTGNNLGYYADNVHPTVTGYDDWAACLLGLFTQCYEVGATRSDVAPIPLTLTNSFIWYNNGFGAPSYWKDANGVVHLGGLLGSPANTTYMNTTAFTLPAGYRPGRTRLQVVGTSVGLMRMDIGSSGAAVPVNMVSPAATTASIFISLENISFLAEA